MVPAPSGYRFRLTHVYESSVYTYIHPGIRDWEKVVESVFSPRESSVSAGSPISAAGVKGRRGVSGGEDTSKFSNTREVRYHGALHVTHTHAHIHTWGNRDVHCQDNARENPFYRKNMKKKGDENLEGTTDEPDIPAPLSLSLTHFLSL